LYFEIKKSDDKRGQRQWFSEIKEQKKDIVENPGPR